MYRNIHPNIYRDIRSSTLSGVEKYYKRKFSFPKTYVRKEVYTSGEKIKVRISEMPEMYRESGLYKIVGEEEEEIEIEEQYYRTDMKIETAEEMNQYVKIIEYWDITILPDFIYDTLLKGKRDMYHAWDGTMFEEEVKKLMFTGVIRYAGSVSLNFLKYLERRNHTFCEYAIMGAICENQMDCFLYLMEKKIPYKPFYLCFKAIEWNRIAIVKYLLEHGCPIYKECVHMSMNCDYTSSDGVEYLKLFHEKGYTFNGEVCTVACQHGNIQCLRYAVEKGYYYNRAECLKICIRERTRCQRFYLVSPNPIHIRYMECEVYMRDLDVFQ